MLYEAISDAAMHSDEEKTGIFLSEFSSIKLILSRFFSVGKFIVSIIISTVSSRFETTSHFEARQRFYFIINRSFPGYKYFLHKKILILQNLKDKLENLYKQYKYRFSSKDPVWVLHRFSDARDIEIIGLITAAYSYGQVDLINKFTDKLLLQTGGKPYEFTINFAKRKDKKYLKGLNYRFNTENDLALLFSAISKAITEYGSLKNLFLRAYDSEGENIVNALTNFISVLNSYSSNRHGYFNYLLPNPNNKSTCKRMNLYLRWMVRKDEIDTGIWSEVSRSKLIMPVDVHVARVSKALKLVERKSVDLKFALELTRNLKKFDNHDPVKYDFSLCHIGIDGVKI